MSVAEKGHIRSMSGNLERLLHGKGHEKVRHESAPEAASPLLMQDGDVGSPMSDDVLADPGSPKMITNDNCKAVHGAGGGGDGRQESFSSSGSDPTENDRLQGDVECIELGFDKVGSGADRKTWGGSMEFILTCVGYAVGLGNVWRFPFLCYKNGGGAFLIPYVIMLALVGLPLFFMELAFGQFASLGPITIWTKINPLFKGLGYGMVLTSWLIGLYYNVIIAHVLFFMFASMTDKLPWSTCDNWWNVKERCRTVADVGTLTTTTAPALAYAAGNTSTNITALPPALGSTVATVLSNLTNTPSQDYYNHYVLQISGDTNDMGALSWKLALCLLLAWGLVYVALIKGVQSLGKVVYFTAIFPYVMLTILLVRGLTLPGASKGIIYYLKPDFSRLNNPRVWSDAATQIFYSLSACSGGLVAMSSFNKFKNNCYRDSLVVPLINCGTSIYSGFVIFAVLGFMAYEKGVDVKDVAAGGPGLAFIVYPEAISRMPAAPFWAICFFFMMATLGFGSQFSIIECVLSGFGDEFHSWLSAAKSRNYLYRGAVVFGMFLLGLPMVTRGGIYLLYLVDYSVSGFPLLVIGLLECITICHIYGYKEFSKDIEMMIGFRPNVYWRICWCWISPAVIIMTIICNIIFYKDPFYEQAGSKRLYYSTAMSMMGWMIALLPILVVPGWALYYYCSNGGWHTLRILSHPTPDWGPLRQSDRSGDHRYAGGPYILTPTQEPNPEDMLGASQAPRGGLGLTVLGGADNTGYAISRNNSSAQFGANKIGDFQPATSNLVDQVGARFTLNIPNGSPGVGRGQEGTRRPRNDTCETNI